MSRRNEENAVEASNIGNRNSNANENEPNGIIQTDGHPRQGQKDARYVKIDKADSSDARIGDGAYGVVYRAMDRVNNEKVALKRIKLENEEGTFFCLFFSYSSCCSNIT